jgi:hypothetical protein
MSWARTTAAEYHFPIELVNSKKRKQNSPMNQEKNMTNLAPGFHLADEENEAPEKTNAEVPARNMKTTRSQPFPSTNKLAT